MCVLQKFVNSNQEYSIHFNQLLLPLSSLRNSRRLCSSLSVLLRKGSNLLNLPLPATTALFTEAELDQCSELPSLSTESTSLNWISQKVHLYIPISYWSLQISLLKALLSGTWLLCLPLNFQNNMTIGNVFGYNRKPVLRWFKQTILFFSNNKKS